MFVAETQSPGHTKRAYRSVSTVRVGCLLVACRHVILSIAQWHRQAYGIWVGSLQRLHHCKRPLSVAKRYFLWIMNVRKGIVLQKEVDLCMRVRVIVCPYE
jgi:hypothetical protein